MEESFLPETPDRADPLSHKVQKLLRELSPRDCFPRADDNSSAEDVRFCRRYAEAERKVGLEVADEGARGDVAGEFVCGGDNLREGVESKILSWEVVRFRVGVAMTPRKLGLELDVTILFRDISRGRQGDSASNSSIWGQGKDSEDNRFMDSEEILLADAGGVGNS
jgi:hypothetical protein